ncbi:hypothetical protein [Luteitalea sp.]|uniref:hypothetical protein n=1 Tax=Luteitalea sp. TaxID=2004800 RepID=UPI0025C26B65|nr:hypothetical protein [Luteitalea sp.]
MEQKNPMVIAYLLFASAALFAVLAVLALTGVVDLGIEPEQLALAFGLVVVADLVIATFVMLRIARR